jgi:hypothetical protein
MKKEKKMVKSGDLNVFRGFCFLKYLLNCFLFLKYKINSKFLNSFDVIMLKNNKNSENKILNTSKK